MSQSRSAKVERFLFITWDGPDTRYLEALFLPIFAALQARGYAPHVLQFGWGRAEMHAARAAACRAQAIPYQAVQLSARSGLARQAYAVSLAAAQIRRACAAWRIDTLLPRSLMPALAVLRLPQAYRRRLWLVFDPDGLMAEERVEYAGLSAQGWQYRVLRDLEARMLGEADLVLCRSEAARQIFMARAGSAAKAGTVGDLTPGQRFQIVINGTDPNPFAKALAARAAGQTARSYQGHGAGEVHLCYSGSLGPQYRLETMLEFAKALRARLPELQFHLFTPAQALVAAAQAGAGLAAVPWVQCRTLRAAEVPGALVQCDLALSLRAEGFARQAVAPIKHAEYLMAGLPVLADPLPAELARAGVGLSLAPQALAANMTRICHELRSERQRWAMRCHAYARAHLSQQVGADSYARALRCLGEPGSELPALPSPMPEERADAAFDAYAL